MHIFNGRQVTKAEFKRLNSLVKQIQQELRTGEKYDYSKWPHVTLKSSGQSIIPMVNGTLFPDE